MNFRLYGTDNGNIKPILEDLNKKIKQFETTNTFDSTGEWKFCSNIVQDKNTNRALQYFNKNNITNSPPTPTNPPPPTKTKTPTPTKTKTPTPTNPPPIIPPPTTTTTTPPIIPPPPPTTTTTPIIPPPIIQRSISSNDIVRTKIRTKPSQQPWSLKNKIKDIIVQWKNKTRRNKTKKDEQLTLNKLKLTPKREHQISQINPSSTSSTSKKSSLMPRSSSNQSSLTLSAALSSSKQSLSTSNQNSSKKTHPPINPPKLKKSHRQSRKRTKRNLKKSGPQNIRKFRKDDIYNKNKLKNKTRRENLKQNFLFFPEQNTNYLKRTQPFGNSDIMKLPKKTKNNQQHIDEKHIDQNNEEHIEYGNPLYYQGNIPTTRKRKIEKPKPNVSLLNLNIRPKVDRQPNIDQQIGKNLMRYKSIRNPHLLRNLMRYKSTARNRSNSNKTNELTARNRSNTNKTNELTARNRSNSNNSNDTDENLWKKIWNEKVENFNNKRTNFK